MLPSCILVACWAKCCKEWIAVRSNCSDSCIGNETCQATCLCTSHMTVPVMQAVKHMCMCRCLGHHSAVHCSDGFLLRSNLTDTLFILFLYNNDFEGDLSVVSGANLGVVSTADNPKLCGMVPASVRWAHGYNPHNTSLGMPCA